MSHAELPLPWNKALLAILPGLLATAGLVRTDFSAWMLAGMGALIAFVMFAYLGNKKRLPSWSLMAVGMLVSAGLTAAAGVVGGLISVVAGSGAIVFVILILWIVLIAVLVASLRGRHVTPFAWALFALIIVCQLAVRVKYFVLVGVSWSVAGEWLSVSLYAAVLALLLPAAIGARLAPRHGLLSILFVIGMVYMGFQILIDVYQKVGEQIGGTFWFYAYKALIPLLFTVVAPLWFLRARTPRGRVWGLLGTVGLATTIDIVIVGLVAYENLPLIIWISAVPYTLSVLLTLAWAYLLARPPTTREPTEQAVP